jgi:hypothetical protein
MKRTASILGAILIVIGTQLRHKAEEMKIENKVNREFQAADNEAKQETRRLNALVDDAYSGRITTKQFEEELEKESDH